MKVHLTTISIMLILGAFSVTQAYATSSNNGGINWKQMCNLADSIISEPCSTLVQSNNPYQLTREGDRVLHCIGGGALALVTGHPELLSLGQSVGCGGGITYDSDRNGGSELRYESDANNNPLGSLLHGLVDESDTNNPIGSILKGLMN
jgi:hypothetical protein